MNWRFVYFFDIETNLSAAEVVNRLQSVSRPKKNIVQTLNPDEMFTGEYKEYIGNVDDTGFRLQKRYYTTRSRTMGLILKGTIEERSGQTLIHVRCTPPLSNLLWFVFPPLWMMIGFCIAWDYSLLHKVPLFTLLCLLLLTYLYRVVLAQFTRRASDNKEYFERLLQKQTNRGNFINILFH